MIEVRCHTNIDDYHRAIWPKSMCCRPIVGDHVLSTCRNHSLKIVSVTHSNYISEDGMTLIPILLIELHRDIS